MEYVLEIILELILDGCFEVSRCKNVPKYVRYAMLAIILLFTVAVLGLIFFAGFMSLKENALVGIILILIGLLMLAAGAKKLRKIYLAKTDNLRNKN